MTTYPNLPQRRPVASRLFAVVSLLFALCLVPLLSAQDNPRKKAYDIPADDAERALKAFAHQSGLEVLFVTEATQGVRTLAVKGEYTPREALDQLLAGTPLTATQSGPTGAYKVRREKSVELAEKNVASRASRDRAADLDEKKEDVVKLDTFEVFGRKTLNMDIPRTRDDVQPYVVFDRETIERAGVNNLEDFFKKRLPMNTQSLTLSQGSGGQTQSAINLRGLGTDETLILVDGRRVANIVAGGPWGQPDINGIPLDAIERIETLPSTAGGIYGGGATGGVINIVLKRKYSGAELSVSYGIADDSVGENYGAAFSAGFTINQGRTRAMMFGSIRDSALVRLRDRPFAQLAQQARVLNNPANFALVSPPLGYTPNIRSAVASVPLVLDTGVALNSTFTSVPVGYAGWNSDGGAALVTRAGTYNLNLSDDSRGLQTPLAAAPKNRSLNVNLRHELSTRVEAYLEASFTEVTNNGYPAPVFPTLRSGGSSLISLQGDAPNNPFQQAIIVALPTPSLTAGRTDNESITHRYLAGLIAKLGRDWTIEASYARNHSANRQQQTSGGLLTSEGVTALQSGALNIIRDVNAFPIDYSSYVDDRPTFIAGPYEMTVTDYTFRFGGPLAERGGHSLKIAGYLQRLETEADALINQTLNTSVPSYLYSPPRSREVSTGYVELTAPLSFVYASRGTSRVELHGAVRCDNFETRSPTPAGAPIATLDAPIPAFAYVTSSTRGVQYMGGLSWTPIADVKLRLSYGSGILPANPIQIAPTVTLLSPPTAAQLNQYGTDPKRGGTLVGRDAAGNIPNSTFTLVTGGNPLLRPEKSESVSVGLVLAPRWLKGFKGYIDYTAIYKADEIASLSPASLYFTYEDLLPGTITRGANLPGDQPGWAGIATGVVRTPVNIAKSHVEVLDIQFEQVIETETFGQFTFSGIATRQFHLRQKIRPDTPWIESVDYDLGPLKWKGNISLSWNKNGIAAEWNTQYYSGYNVVSPGTAIAPGNLSVRLQGDSRVSPQISHDLFVRYSVGRARNRWARNSTISLGVQNVFNTAPAFYFNGGYSFHGDPLMRRYSISFKRMF